VRDAILICGLSADPVHLGHVRLVIEASSALHRRGRPISRLILMPVYRRNPVGTRKDDLPETYPQRFAMCALAAIDIRAAVRALGISVEVSTIEAELAQDRETPNFTSETLAVLRERTSEAALLFLISSELVAGKVPELSRWHEVNRILNAAELVICPRPQHTTNEAYLSELRAAGGQITDLNEVRTPEIASRDIRRRLHAGEDPLTLAAEDLLPVAVAHFLKEQQLYTAPPAEVKP